MCHIKDSVSGTQYFTILFHISVSKQTYFHISEQYSNTQLFQIYFTAKILDQKCYFFLKKPFNADLYSLLPPTAFKITLSTKYSGLLATASSNIRVFVEFFGFFFLFFLKKHIFLIFALSLQCRKHFFPLPHHALYVWDHIKLLPKNPTSL